MANIKSAKKRIRQTEKREARNQNERLDIKKSIKKLEKATKSEVKKISHAIESKVAKASKKGVIHKNKAARLQRKISKLAL